MARAATTSDVFNAIAEPRRREILTVLRDGERTVTDLVVTLGLEQPQVSKHLRVLREVEAVSVREDGRLRLYRLNARGLRPLGDFVASFEQIWNERFDAIDALLEELNQGDAPPTSSTAPTTPTAPTAPTPKEQDG